MSTKLAREDVHSETASHCRSDGSLQLFHLAEKTLAPVAWEWEPDWDRSTLASLPDECPAHISVPGSKGSLSPHHMSVT